MMLQTVSNGLGGQSMFCLWLACEKRIPATVSITADTGSENDCLTNTGERVTAAEFFRDAVLPLASKYGINARFVRSVDRQRQPLPPIHVYLEREIQRWKRGERRGHYGSQPVPLFGSRHGKLKQNCTSKWKITAITQEARRLGAKHLRAAQGIHLGEYDRRARGVYLRDEDGWSIYQTTVKRKKKEVAIKWCTHYYPLVDLKMNREDVRRALDQLGIPYLVSSQCDHCPYQDYRRWKELSQESIDRITALEAKYDGQYFFTDKLIPLPLAIEEKGRDEERKRSRPVQLTMFDEPELDFGCGNSYCGV